MEPIKKHRIERQDVALEGLLMNGLVEKAGEGEMTTYHLSEKGKMKGKRK